MSNAAIDDLLAPKEAASFLKVSSSWLAKARISGYGPRFIKIGRSVRYSLHALEEFKRANARGSTSEYERRPGPGRPAKEKCRSCTETVAIREDYIGVRVPALGQAVGSIETTGINGNAAEST
jgi:hypothetical protein